MLHVRTSIKRDRPCEGVGRIDEDRVPPFREWSGGRVVAEPVRKGQGQFLQLRAGEGSSRRGVYVCPQGPRESSHVARRAGCEEPGEDGGVDDGNVGYMRRVDSRGHGGGDRD